MAADKDKKNSSKKAGGAGSKTASRKKAPAAGGKNRKTSGPKKKAAKEPEKKKTNTGRKNTAGAARKSTAKKSMGSSTQKTGRARKKTTSSSDKSTGSSGRSRRRKMPELSSVSFTDKINDVNVTVLGTAHISRESVNDVEKLFDYLNPDITGVELCESRFKTIMDESAWKKLDIVEVIKQKKLYLLMSSVILSAFQKKMGKITGTKPGAEMIRAIELAHENESRVALIDRDVQITLKRAWQSLGYFTKINIVAELIVGLFHPGHTDEKTIEEMKQTDVLADLFSSLPPRYDYIRQIIITERDKYLAAKIREYIEEFDGKGNMLAVVGAGHVEGIKQYLHEDIDTVELEYIKPKSPVWGWVKFFLPVAIILGLLFWFTDKSSWQTILNDILTWTVIKASVSGFFALILMAHPLAVISAALTAPISNFNPVLKPGWVAALIEAKFRKPAVADFESIADDVSTFKGFYRNRVMRVFAVFTLPQLGSSIATGLALWYLAG